MRYAIGVAYQGYFEMSTNRKSRSGASNPEAVCSCPLSAENRYPLKLRFQ